MPASLPRLGQRLRAFRPQFLWLSCIRQYQANLPLVSGWIHFHQRFGCGRAGQTSCFVQLARLSWLD